MHQEVCISTNWRSEVGVEREVEAVVLILARLFVLNCHVFCLSQASKELAIKHLQDIFIGSLSEVFD